MVYKCATQPRPNAGSEHAMKNKSWVQKIQFKTYALNANYGEEIGIIL
jgi:hypothetical protein